MAAQELLKLLSSSTDVLVVWDTEFTAWPGSQERGWTGPGEHRELVQIGAVALAATAEFKEIATFERVIQPTINPRLSPYFMELTGISQERVDCDGIPFPAALEAFADFVNRWSGGIVSLQMMQSPVTRAIQIDRFVSPKLVSAERRAAASSRARNEDLPASWPLDCSWTGLQKSRCPSRF